MTHSETQVELKECPFCGSMDLTVRDLGDGETWVVSCNGCNAEGGYYPEPDSTLPMEAARLWNTRTQEKES